MFLFRIYLIFMSQKCKAINCLVIREVILTCDKIGDFSLIATTASKALPLSLLATHTPFLPQGVPPDSSG